MPSMSPWESSTSSRMLALFFDGTMDEYSSTNTNVVKLFSLLNKNSSKQLCYYQAGFGTYFNPGVVSPMFTWIAKIADEAVAWYLDAHVIEGYTFLMQNYREGDKICIFGFSRGAYTARALGGMLYKVGLLSKDNSEQLPFAYKMFKRTDKEGIQLAAGFKQTFAQNVYIEFMGVWDTVVSVGIIVGRTLPFTNSNSSVKTFRHALSLDEHRAKFRPNFFHRPFPAHRNTSPTSLKGKGPMRWVGKSREATKVEVNDDDKAEPDRSSKVETDVLEVWFSGCHSDVGGGIDPDTIKHSLAQITLRWMIRQICSAQCGIIFDEEALSRHDIDLPPPPVKSSEASSAGLADDAPDAIQPLHDGLKTNPLWWILEIIPGNFPYQDDEGRWHSNWSFHLGKGRFVPTRRLDNGPKFHVSVRQRMEDKVLNYKPKAIWKPGTEVYLE